MDGCSFGLTVRVVVVARSTVGSWQVFAVDVLICHGMMIIIMLRELIINNVAVSLQRDELFGASRCV